MEDYTNKYKGEQVEVALFGGEYQEGVLTAYCYVEDVAHIELNGHILVPLQNIASLHCSSRCDAPDDDWPPRGLEQEDGRLGPRLGRPARRSFATSSRPGPSCSERARCSGCRLGARRLSALSIFIFCGVLLASALYWYADRVAVGLVGARELPGRRRPGCIRRSSGSRRRAGVAKPRLYLIDDGLPRALAAGRGPHGSAIAVSTGLLAASPAELEGVLAHELAHVRHRDIVVQTSVVVARGNVCSS